MPWGLTVALVALPFPCPPVSIARSQPAEIQSAPSTISVNTSADDARVQQGNSIIISWKSTDAPVGSAVALFPVKELTGHVFDPIATSLPTSGSYTWYVPIFVVRPNACAPDRTGGCVGSMNPDAAYRIVARLYTPADAEFLEFGATKTHPTYIVAAESGVFTMLPAP
jgi:hypothetical protein